MKKRILAVVLAGVLAASMTGCGGKKNANVTEDGRMIITMANSVAINDNKLDEAYAEAVTVYAAIYEGTELKGIDMKSNVTAGDTWQTDLSGYNSQTQTIKVFIWDNDMEPQAISYSPVVAETALNF